ncbi:hypothetical protein L596_023433 [Steinernema carpocapsae]|uniref:Uncharacterized protein n=1 Tax=Steinernema carpocapsae TaxID=34508 RepID=A0A4U5MDN8_STECR|nr:hypothetical protein L596_023433 [Steinernema carpocapsae]
MENTWSSVENPPLLEAENPTAQPLIAKVVKFNTPFNGGNAPAWNQNIKPESAYRDELVPIVIPVSKQRCSFNLLEFHVVAARKEGGEGRGIKKTKGQKAKHNVTKSEFHVPGPSMKYQFEPLRKTSTGSASSQQSLCQTFIKQEGGSSIFSEPSSSQQSCSSDEFLYSAEFPNVKPIRKPKLTPKDAKKPSMKDLKQMLNDRIIVVRRESLRRKEELLQSVADELGGLPCFHENVYWK